MKTRKTSNPKRNTRSRNRSTDNDVVAVSPEDFISEDVKREAKRIDQELIKQFVRTLYGRKRKSITLPLAPQLFEAFLARASWLEIPIELYLVSLLTADWLHMRMDNAEFGATPDNLDTEDYPPMVNINPPMGEILAQISHSEIPEWRLVQRKHATGDKTLRDAARECNVSLRDFIHGAFKAQAALDILNFLSLEQQRALENRFKPRSRPRPPCHSSPRTGV